jgi:hypothetical protein
MSRSRPPLSGSIFSSSMSWAIDQDVRNAAGCRLSKLPRGPASGPRLADGTESGTQRPCSNSITPARRPRRGWPGDSGRRALVPRLSLAIGPDNRVQRPEPSSLLKPAVAIYRLGKKPNPWAAQIGRSNLRQPLRRPGRHLPRPRCFFAKAPLPSRNAGPVSHRSQTDRETGWDSGRTPTHIPQGEMPVEWFASRIIGVSIASGEYADICSSAWISRLRITLMVE